MERIWLPTVRDPAIIEEFKNNMSLSPIHLCFTDWCLIKHSTINVFILDLTQIRRGTWNEEPQ
jgi:hypothetical protein